MNYLSFVPFRFDVVRIPVCCVVRGVSSSFLRVIFGLWFSCQVQLVASAYPGRCGMILRVPEPLAPLSLLPTFVDLLPCVFVYYFCYLGVLARMLIEFNVVVVER